MTIRRSPSRTTVTQQRNGRGRTLLAIALLFTIAACTRTPGPIAAIPVTICADGASTWSSPTLGVTASNDRCGTTTVTIRVGP